jgi:hypothetical protein
MPTRLDPMALNDHSDWRSDSRVLRILSSVEASFRPVCDQLTGCLARFDGYAETCRAALGIPGGGRILDEISTLVLISYHAY